MITEPQAVADALVQVADASRVEAQVPAAVDADQLAGDVAGFVGAKERARGRDVVDGPGR